MVSSGFILLCNFCVRLLVFFALPVLESGSVHLVTPLIRPHFFSRLRESVGFQSCSQAMLSVMDAGHLLLENGSIPLHAEAWKAGWQFPSAEAADGCARKLHSSLSKLARSVEK